MPDSRFYRRAGPFRLGDLAGRVGGALHTGADDGKLIHDVAGIETADADEIGYFSDQRYLENFAACKAGACLTTAAFAARAPSACAVIVVADPRAAFAAVAAAFYPETPVGGVSSDAYVAPDAAIGEGVSLAPGAVISAGADIGARSRIGANAVIGPGVVIGADCRIAPNVTLSHCILGARVILHPGVQIGQDGFGFVPTPKGMLKVPQLGRVLIHDDVEIGANCTIDRGAAGDTIIGAGTKIDNLVQIGHNVEIGRNCVIVSQVGISGSCRIGNGVVLGGQVGLADHVHLGDGAQVAAKSGVMRDVKAGEVVMGYPARPIRQFWRDIAALARLTKRDK